MRDGPPGGSVASPAMKLRFPALLAAAFAALAPASGAVAATVTTDAACYVAGGQIGVAGAEFGPGNTVFLEGEQMFASVPADAGGIFSATLKAPSLGAVIGPASKSFTITATDQATRAAASTKIKVVNLTFATNGGIKSPKAKRTWSFSGFLQRPGKPIFGHFRHGGKTYANYRFGVPKGSCGMLKKRAPGIPAKRLRTGKWTVQVDFERSFKRNASPRVTSTTTIFTTFR